MQIENLNATKEITEALQRTGQLLNELREAGAYADMTGMYDMLAAITSQQILTGVLALQMLLRIEEARSVPQEGEPVIVGTPVDAPEPEVVVGRCFDCARFSDPAEGDAVRSCPSCGRKLKRNRS